MTRRTLTTRTFAAATLAALALSTAPAGAQEDGVATEEYLEKIRQGLATTAWPEDGRVTASISNGRYVIQGMTDGAANVPVGRQMLRGIDGLDLSLVDVRIVRQ